MKVLQLCPLYFPYIGGVEEQVRNLSERLARDNEVTVFTTDNSDLPIEEEINGVMVWRFGSFSPNNSYHICLSMIKKLKEQQFDIFHGHNYHSFPLFLIRYAQARRFVVTPHYHRHGVTRFSNLLARLYKPIGRSIYQRADRIVANSAYEKDILIEDFHLENSRVEVIPNGISVEDFRGLVKNPGEHKTILCVARLDKFKGIQYAIQAMPMLAQSTRLEIVGDGSYKKELIKLADRLGVRHRIDFYGNLGHQQLTERYVNADLFMLLSQYESYGITVGEALAAKTPSIVSNTSALKHWIDDRNCFGIDYPINNTELIQLINRVIGTPVTDVELWDWDRVSAQTYRLYEDLLN